MRLSMPVLLAACGLAGVWAQAALPPTASGAAAPSSAVAAEGLAARLIEIGAPPLAGLAAAPGPDGRWQVRGRAPLPGGAAAGWPAPLYAEAAALCDAGLERSACWRIERLEIDGRAAEIRP